MASGKRRVGYGKRRVKESEDCRMLTKKEALKARGSQLSSKRVSLKTKLSYLAVIS
jgi:hypothetical protein